MYYAVGPVTVKSCPRQCRNPSQVVRSRLRQLFFIHYRSECHRFIPLKDQSATGSSRLTNQNTTESVHQEHGPVADQLVNVFVELVHLPVIGLVHKDAPGT